MTKWITADYHIGETRLDLLGRPFRSPEHMFDVFVTNHNALVAPDDEVIVVGDVCRCDPKSLPLINQFNGKKTLVRGNHDRQFSDEVMSQYFDRIIPDGEGLEIEAAGVPCYVVHYPTRGRVDRFNLTAHVHSAWKYQLNCLNVGVDAHHFLPVNLDSIDWHLKAISEYYDEDVWVAYNRVNTTFRGFRGKEGSYFRK